MNEVAGLRAAGVFPTRAPTDLTKSLQDIGDRLLRSMMVNSRSRPRPYLEEATPQDRFRAGFRRDRSQTLRTGCLRGSRGEVRGTDDTNRRIAFHDVFSINARDSSLSSERMCQVGVQVRARTPPAPNTGSVAGKGRCSLRSLACRVGASRQMGQCW